MRNPNKKRKPKHMTKCKYIDFWLAISKCTKRVSMKPPICFNDFMDNYDNYTDWYNDLKHINYKKYDNTNWLQNKNRWRGF